MLLRCLLSDIYRLGVLLSRSAQVGSAQYEYRQICDQVGAGLYSEALGCYHNVRIYRNDHQYQIYGIVYERVCNLCQYS